MTSILPTQESSQPTYNREEWLGGYQSQNQEYDYWIEEIEGEIPSQLQGTLFRNGPGALDVQGVPLKHPFDGDGMVCAFTFTEGKVHFRNRFVRTEAFVEEQAAGKMLYRGVFGTAKPGGWLNNAFDLRTKNIANTNVIYWGEKLLALWEAGQPYCLNPQTLETLGIDCLDGILQPGESFAAHPWVDPSCEFNNGKPCLVNFAIKPGLSTNVTIYEIDTAGKLLRKQVKSLPGFAFIHDFAITPNYCIFFHNPVQFNPLPFVFGFRGAGECVKFQPQEATKIVIIPRNPDAGEKMQTLEIKAGFVFHHANAFEKEGKIYLDSICYESLPELEPEQTFNDVDWEDLNPGQLWRFELDLAAEKVSKELVYERCCEFPVVNPGKVGQDYRYAFMGAAMQNEGNAPLQGIAKLDWLTGEQQLWSAAPTGFVSEPIFVPKPEGEAEDAGWLLTLVYDGKEHRSNLVILDAEDLNKGPVARLWLQNHIPYGLHGSWADVK